MGSLYLGVVVVVIVVVVSSVVVTPIDPLPIYPHNLSVSARLLTFNPYRLGPTSYIIYHNHVDQSQGL